MTFVFDDEEQRRQWRIDALFWAYLGFLEDYPKYESARASMATQLLELGAIP